MAGGSLVYFLLTITSKRRRKGTYHPPSMKIPPDILQSPLKRCKIVCTYCSSARRWKHGFYERKGFHSNLSGQPRKIPRYLCRNPSCNRTYSVLPPDILPICRFFWSDLITLVPLFASNLSIHQIAKLHPRWNRWTLSRLRRYLGNLNGFLDRLLREMDHYEPLFCFRDKISLVLSRWDWIEFRRMWSRFAYPTRFVPIRAHTI